MLAKMVRHPNQGKKDRWLVVWEEGVGAIVFFEVFLREAVEGEGSDSALKPRGGDAPGAVGAAPAGEVVPFDPDQAFTHTSPAFCVRGIGARRQRLEHIKRASLEGELLPTAEDYCPRNSKRGQ
jgi:hypothetical protein